MNVPVLELKNVQLRRGTREILRGVTFDASPGEIVVVMGTSGSGKTTILRAIAGLDRHDSGSINIEGGRAGMVFQFHCLFEHLSAIDNICLAPVHAHGVRKDEAMRRAHELLAAFGVDHRATALPRELSGGEAQRVAIARALAVDPRVLLLDNELWPESPYRAVLRAISRDEHVPLVDSLQLIADARTQLERGMESRFHLEPASAPAPAAAPAATSGDVTVVFRVYEGSYPASRQLSIVGNQPAVGNFSPNTVAMHDDGKDGDEHAADHVWTYRATLAAGTRVRYVYTNSGGQGRWEGLDLPHVREVQVKAPANGGPMYLPVESFGKIYMQADNWHTDASGYDLIAHAVVDALK